MITSFTGGCFCGAARYEIAAEPVAMNHCQCRQCQKDSGTGHGSFLVFLTPDAKLTGEIRCFEIVGDAGTVKSRNFCPACGTQLYIAFPAMPELIAVRAGTLDDASRFRPQFTTWTASAQPWDHMDPVLTRFEKMPPPN